eukprot:2709773-Prymnesium_polylepis.6
MQSCAVAAFHPCPRRRGFCPPPFSVLQYLAYLAFASVHFVVVKKSLRRPALSVGAQGGGGAGGGHAAYGGGGHRALRPRVSGRVWRRARRRRGG